MLSAGGRVVGQVAADFQGNGTLDTADVPQNGVRVFLEITNARTGVTRTLASQTTDADGRFAFESVGPGGGHSIRIDGVGITGVLGNRFDGDATAPFVVRDGQTETVTALVTLSDAGGGSEVIDGSTDSQSAASVLLSGDGQTLVTHGDLRANGTLTFHDLGDDAAEPDVVSLMQPGSIWVQVRLLDLSDDGRTVLFSTKSKRIRGAERTDSQLGRALYVYDRDTDSFERLTGILHSVREASLSGDGSTIAYEEDDFATGARRIVLLDRIAGTSTTLLGERFPDADLQSPSISADGRFVVFSSHDARLLPGGVDAGDRHVYRYDRQTDTLDLVSDPRDPGLDAANYDAPAGGSISDDGQQVLFARVRAGVRLMLWVWDAETGERTAIADETVPARAYDTFLKGPPAAIAGDGKSVVFRHRGTGRDGDEAIERLPDLFRREIATGQTTRLFSPDGSASPDPFVPNADGIRPFDVAADGRVAFTTFGANLDNNFFAPKYASAVHLAGRANQPPELGAVRLRVPADSAIGTAAGRIPISDEGPVRITVLGGTGRDLFAVADDGTVTVATSLPTVAEPTAYSLRVRAIDEGSPTRGDVRTYSVQVFPRLQPTLEDATAASIEHPAAGTAIATVRAIDSPDAFAYAIVGDANGLAIDAVTGRVIVTDPARLDFETAPTIAVTIRATERTLPGVAPNTDEATLTVTLTDRNERPVASDTTLTVTEHAPAGTVVGRVPVGDPDGDAFTVRLSGWIGLHRTGTDGGPRISLGDFRNPPAEIDADGTVRVLLPAAFDAEDWREIRARVTVSDGELSTTGMLTIRMDDVNEPPRFRRDTFGADGPAGRTFDSEITENAAAGAIITPVSTRIDGSAVQAIDPEGGTVRYEIVGGTLADAVAIDARTGTLTLTDPSVLDHEERPRETLVVRATDDGFSYSGPNQQPLSSTAGFTILVRDFDEPPTAEPRTVTIPENLGNGAGIVRVAGVDPEGARVRYAFLRPQAGGDATASQTASGFAIDEATGRITVHDSSRLDFERTEEIVLRVQVRSFPAGVVHSGSRYQYGETEVRVRLTDRPEPLRLHDVAFGTPENQATGTEVFRLRADDHDGERLRYELIDAGDGLFTLDADTGAIRVADKARLDAERFESTRLRVRVRSLDSDEADIATVRIAIENRVETPDLGGGLIIRDEFARGIDTGDPLREGATLHRFAMRADRGQSVYQYAISKSGRDADRIVLHSTRTIYAAGVPVWEQYTVRVKGGPRDFETLPVIKFRLTLHGPTVDGQPITDVAAFTVRLRDVQEAPVLDDASVFLPGTLDVGDTAFVMQAMADDPIGPVRYRIVASSVTEGFAIDEETGAVTLTDVSDEDRLLEEFLDAGSRFILTIEAYDSGDPRLANTAELVMFVDFG